MALYKHQITSDDVRIMIETIGRAGFKRVVGLSRVRHPRMNIEKNIKIFLDTAKYGLTEAGLKNNTSRQYALVVTKRFYADALEVLKFDARKNKG
jgi:hypothetical protein